MLGFVLLIFVGWAPALFVTVVLGGIALAIDRFGLFSVPPTPLGATDPPARPDRVTDTPDR